MTLHPQLRSMARFGGPFSFKDSVAQAKASLKKWAAQTGRPKCLDRWGIRGEIEKPRPGPCPQPRVARAWTKKKPFTGKGSVSLEEREGESAL